MYRYITFCQAKLKKYRKNVKTVQKSRVLYKMQDEIAKLIN